MPAVETGEKVVVEITAEQVVELSREIGKPVSAAEAAALLRDGAGAHSLWKHMMRAGQECIAQALAVGKK